MKRAAFILLFLLAGCNQYHYPSRDDVITGLNQRYGGKNADDFFLTYGMPSNQHQLNNGDRMYSWVSIEQGYQTVPVYNRFGTYYGYRNFYNVDSGFTEYPVERYCQLQILTNRRGIIQQIKLLADSNGKYAPSHCSEVFFTPIPSQP